MIKLLVPAILVLLILGAIIYFIFFKNNPQNSSTLETTQSQTKTNLSEIKAADLKIKEPEKPIFANLYAPKETKASGYVRLSDVAGKVLIQLKSDSTTDQVGIIYKGTCNQKGEIAYPLATLKDGKSQTVRETKLEEISKQLPLSVKVFKDAKNFNAYTRCADLKI